MEHRQALAHASRARASAAKVRSRRAHRYDLTASNSSVAKLLRFEGRVRLALVQARNDQPMRVCSLLSRFGSARAVALLACHPLYSPTVPPDIPDDLVLRLSFAPAALDTHCPNQPPGFGSAALAPASNVGSRKSNAADRDPSEASASPVASRSGPPAGLVPARLGFS